MRKKSFLTALLLVLALTMATVMFAFAGCKPSDEDKDKGQGGNGGGDNTQTVGCYYLSVLDDGTWTSYSSDSSVPADKKFVADEDVYTLSVHLAEGDSVKIAQVGSQTIYGYDAIFSTNTQLTEGSGNAISVGETGTYKLTLDLSDTSISYKFTPDNSGSDEAEVVSVEITETAVNLTVGGTQKLNATATLSDDTTTTEGITWIIEDTTVATVAKDGTVTAVKAGDTSIIAKCGDVESAPVLISVTEAGPELGTVELEETSIRLSVGATETLNYTLTEPAVIVNWNSDTPSVATVDQNGKVTAEAAGTAIITLYYKPNAEANMTSVSCTVTVNTPVTAININNILSVAAESSATLTVGFTPANATNQNYTYEVTAGSDKVEVTKSGNQLTVEGLAKGSATLTVTSEDGEYTATCEITVVEAGAVTANLSTTALSLNLGSDTSETLTATVTGDTVSSIAWSSSSTAVATVDANGVVTAKAYGTTTITATITTENNGDIEKTCTVRVAPLNFFLYGYADTWQKTDDEVNSDVMFTNNNDGTFTLTRELDILAYGFRIGALDSGYFFLTGNDSGYGYSNITTGTNVITAGSSNNIQPSVKGTYTITVNLTAAAPTVTITRDAITVTDITLKVVDNPTSTLYAGESNNSATITFEVTPEGATCAKENVSWSCESPNVTYVIADDGMSVTVTAKDDAVESTVSISCTVNNITKSCSLSIVPKGGSSTPVSDITFDQSAYTFDVSSASEWTVEVLAKVDTAATNKGVTYSCDNANVSIDGNKITATKIGTYTITATADGDSSKTDTATVTFYPGMFYMTGGDAGWLTDPLTGTTVGTDYEYSTFTANEAKTVFTLEAKLSKNGTFKILFIGGDWTNALTGESCTVSGAAADDGTSNHNIKVSGETGIYTVTINIAGTTPTVTVTRTGDVPSFTATINGVTSGTSTPAHNLYEMSVEVTLASAISESSPLEITIGGSATKSYSYTEALAAGNYRLKVACDANGNVKSVTYEVIVNSWVTSTDNYSVAVYTTSTEGTWPTKDTSDLAVYYNSAEKQYKLCFAYTIEATDASFTFGILLDSAWKCTLESNSTIGTRNITTSKITGSTSNQKFTVNSTGKVYFELVFTESSGSYTFVSLTASDTDLNT